MPTDTSGNFSLVPSYFAQPGTAIRTEQHNPVLEDIAQALSSRLMRDGRNGMVGNLDMGGFAIKNLKPGTKPEDIATIGQGVPIGAIVDYAGSAAPTGWLFCYGQAVSRSTYAALFSAIGTTYGTGNGSTTFNLPDLRGRVAAGKDNMGGTAAGQLTSAGGVDGTTLGAAGGAQTHTLTLGQIPAHKHNVGVTVSGTANTRVRDEYAVQNGGNRIASTNGQNISGSSSDPTGLNLSVSVSESDRGSGQAHPIVQPTIVMNKIIKAAY